MESLADAFPPKLLLLLLLARLPDLLLLERSVEHDTIMHSEAAEMSVGDDDISDTAKLSGDSNESFAYGSSLFSSDVESPSSPRMQSAA